jgi:Kef-type K+ transport system membrane component KefB
VLVSFLGPFAVASATAYWLLDWSLKAALIGGTALSTTSLAVVYAVLVERGLNATRIGKLIMSATFVTDVGTALALSAIFIRPNARFPLFLVASIAVILVLPRIAPWFFGRYGDRVIEPEIKLVFVARFVFMVLADAAKGHGVLPAFILGLALANHFREHRKEQKRRRVVAFAFLTPFAHAANIRAGEASYVRSMTKVA